MAISAMGLALVLVTSSALAAPSPMTTTSPPELVPHDDADGTPGVRATFLVEAPAPVVLDLLWDVRRFRRVFPDIKALTVVWSKPNDVEVKFDVDAVIASPTYTLRRHLDHERAQISWRNTAGDLKKIVGRWIVTPAGPSTSRVVYESYVDVGIPGASTIYRDVAKSKLDQMAERVRAGAKEALATAPPSTAPTLSAPPTATAPPSR